MNYLKVLLLASLLLLPISLLWADDDYDQYAIRVCNAGQITVDVATAYKDEDLFHEYWVIDRWKHVHPGTCERVFQNQYPTTMVIQGILGLPKHPVHLAFAFRDSTGVWGAAKVKPPNGIAASHLQLCVDKGDNKYRVEKKDPATVCTEQPDGFLIPASIDYELTSNDSDTSYVAPWTGKYIDNSVKFTVALGPNDRAIPLGSKTSTSASASGQGTDDEFVSLLRGATDALPHSDETRGPEGNIQLKPGYRWVNACAETSVVSKESLANLQSARAKALTETIRKFILAHNKGTIRFRVTEPTEAFFVVEQIGGKTGDCVDAGDREYEFQSPDGGSRRSGNSHPTTPQGDIDFLKALDADVREFIAAAAQGFESYKAGEPKTGQDGVRWWDSSRKPGLAKSCEVQQRGQTNSFLCVLATSSDKEKLETTFEGLVADVVAALPKGWTTTVKPPFNNVIASKGFVSSDGMTGQIWIALDSRTKEYSLIYQIVSNKPSKPVPAPAPAVGNRSMTPDDDPIGAGGFITPYHPPR